VDAALELTVELERAGIGERKICVMMSPLTLLAGSSQ
jgi:hypothetical protein